jgi:hypothetical protein
MLRRCVLDFRADTSLNDRSDLLEARMRAALHLDRPASSTTSPSPPRHTPAGRHRFVQDGEVPVVVVNPRQQRPETEQAALNALEGSLARERATRQAADTALEQARVTIHQLQTRLAHAEMAQREAAPASTPAPAAPMPAVAQASAPKRARARPRGPAKAGSRAEDKPIEWWKPGWKERLRDGQA